MPGHILSMLTAGSTGGFMRSEVVVWVRRRLSAARHKPQTLSAPRPDPLGEGLHKPVLSMLPVKDPLKALTLFQPKVSPKSPIPLEKEQGTYSHLKLYRDP